jgi:hypothetical protein
MHFKADSQFSTKDYIFGKDIIAATPFELHNMNGIIQSESYLAKTSYLLHNLGYTT